MVWYTSLVRDHLVQNQQSGPLIISVSIVRRVLLAIESFGYGRCFLEAYYDALKERKSQIKQPSDSYLSGWARRK